MARLTIKDDQLRDRILLEITKSFPFSLADVKAVFDLTSSFDDTIRACDASIELGIRYPINVVSFPVLPDKARE